MTRPLVLTLAIVLMPDAYAAPPGYLTPPAPIDAILDAPAPPGVSLSPTRDRLALVTTARYPGIAELAEPMLRLAGVPHQPRHQRSGARSAYHGRVVHGRSPTGRKSPSRSTRPPARYANPRV